MAAYNEYYWAREISSATRYLLERVIYGHEKGYKNLDELYEKVMSLQQVGDMPTEWYDFVRLIVWTTAHTLNFSY